MTGTVVSAPPRPVTPHGILAATLADLSRELDATAGVDPALLARLREAAELAGGLEPYLERCTTAESPALRTLARRTQVRQWGGPLEQEMLSGHVEGRFLAFLVHATRATRVLEIGMFTGYSALAMAEALPADGIVVTCEVDHDVVELAQECFAESPHGEKIVVHLGPAGPTLAALAETGAVFDLVFVDADKAGYAAYLDQLLTTGLLAPGGIVCVDNTLMQGGPWTSQEPTPNGLAIADFNDRVAADPRIEQVVIPLRDGLTLIRRVEEVLDA